MSLTQFTIHQLGLTREESNQINRLGGWDAAMAAMPKVKFYFYKDEDFDSAAWEYYEVKAAGWIDTSCEDPLEAIFEAGNGMQNNAVTDYKRGATCTSISVGDIVELADGFHRVEGCGFARVPGP